MGMQHAGSNMHALYLYREGDICDYDVGETLGSREGRRVGSNMHRILRVQHATIRTDGLRWVNISTMECRDVETWRQDTQASIRILHVCILNSFEHRETCMHIRICVGV